MATLRYCDTTSDATLSDLSSLPDMPPRPVSPSSSDEGPITSWNDARIIECSQLRLRESLRRNVEINRLLGVQKHLRKDPDIPHAEVEASRQAQIYKAWIQDHEGSPVDLAIINNDITEPADGCPSYDFVWVNGYVHDETVPPSNPDELVGCDCDDEVCDPATCKCIDRAAPYDTLGVYTGEGCRKFAYKEDGTLAEGVTPRYPVFECNSKCGCSSACINRVAQKGRQVRIDFFKSAEKGWGIRAAEKIRERTFIGVYAGELVNDEEGDRRANIYENVGSTYHFTLDSHCARVDAVRRKLDADGELRGLSDAAIIESVNKHIALIELKQADSEFEEARATLKKRDDDRIATLEREGLLIPRKRAEIESQRKEWEEAYLANPDSFPNLNKLVQMRAKELDEYLEGEISRNEMTVDGALHGNFTRFFNHSCEPTLSYYMAWIDEGSIWRPFICFFAARAIEPGEELTFSYTSDVTDDPMIRESKAVQLKGAVKPGTRTMKCLCKAENCRGLVFA